MRVHVKVVEGGKERVQIFEGTVLSRKEGGSRSAFLVRKISGGFGVERSFLIHSPRVDRIDVTRRGMVRRAKLFYLRGKVGKATRIKEKRTASSPSRRGWPAGPPLPSSVLVVVWTDRLLRGRPRRLPT